MMRLEDALLCMTVEGDGVLSPAIGEMCSLAIAGGVDMLRLVDPHPSSAGMISEVCRRDDAIFMLSDDAEMVVSVGAEGVHLGSPNESVGFARAVVGLDAIVGLTAVTPDQLRLALEVGADYVVYEGGTDCPAVFASFGRAAGVPLFAGGIKSLEDAATIVEGGIYRLCIDGGLVAQGDITGNVAEYSRLLGRSI